MASTVSFGWDFERSDLREPRTPIPKERPEPDQIPTPTAEADHISLNIMVGPISLNYNVSKDFLKDLPGTLAELQKFDIFHVANANSIAH